MMDKSGRHRFCGNCGTPTQDGDAYCSNCGSKVTDDVATVRESAATAPASSASQAHAQPRRSGLITGLVVAFLAVLILAGGAGAFVLTDGFGRLSGDADVPADNVAEPEDPPVENTSPPEESEMSANEQERQRIEEFAQDYDAAYRDEDWQETYSMLSSDSQDEFTEDEWAEAQQAQLDEDGLPAALDYVSVYRDEYTTDIPAQVVFNYEDGDTQTITAGVPMVVQDDSEMGVPKRFLQSPEIEDLSELIADETPNSDSPDSPPDESYQANESGAIGADLPEEWDERRTDEVWTLNDVAVGPAITATANLSAWEETGEATAGTFFAASSSLADSSTDDEILASSGVSFPDSCTPLETEDFSSHGYTGRLQGGTDCAPNGKTIVNVVASPEGRECVMFVQVGYLTDEEKEWAERVLDTFEADCQEVADYEAGLEDYVAQAEPPPAVEPAAPAPQTVSCNIFASQFSAMQYYLNASAEEQATLDPDGNGYACDVELLGYQLDAQETNYVSPIDDRPGTLENTCEGMRYEEDIDECVDQQQAVGNPDFTD